MKYRKNKGFVRFMYYFSEFEAFSFPACTNKSLSGSISFFSRFSRDLKLTPITPNGPRSRSCMSRLRGLFSPGIHSEAALIVSSSFR